LKDRRIAEYRRAADRHEEAGNTATARMYRNDAYVWNAKGRQAATVTIPIRSFKAAGSMPITRKCARR